MNGILDSSPAPGNRLFLATDIGENGAGWGLSWQALLFRTSCAGTAQSLTAGQKFGIIPDVVVFREKFRGKHQAERPGREVIEFPPDHRGDVQPVERAVQVKPRPFATIIDGNIEASTRRNQELLEVPVGVPPAALTARYVIEIIHTPYPERYMPGLLNKRDVSPRIGKLRQGYDAAC